ncbi:MAG: phosphoenolpyruvate--protein phosphotransferase [Spirochaetes bacterium]|nr:phosphoenolpyruvate--protein phosphotransferase [Spirochaetota bacterium]
MKQFSGIPASPGIAIGRAFVFFDDEGVQVPSYSISASDVGSEWSRLVIAIDKAKVEVELLRDRARDEMGDEQSAIFDAHLLMMQDPDLFERMESSLKSNLRNIEWVILQLEQELVQQLSEIDDPYIRERTSDIHDVSKRILNHLLFRERMTLDDLKDDVVLVAHDLLPSDLISMNRDHVKAIVMDQGGRTSHTAILARAFEVPAVLGLGNVMKSLHAADLLIVDGKSGIVIVEPDDATLELYEGMRDRFIERERTLIADALDIVSTKDGKRVFLKANIEVPEEARAALRNGADGVGLFRSEFLFLQPGRVPDEDEQTRAYSEVLQVMKDRPVTIRTLDLGGDKALAELTDYSEKNPLLGWRAIRFCLSRQDIFRTQLRAILRASVHGDVRIMFPMISGVEELELSLALLGLAREDCDKRGIPYRKDIPTGIMIEIPSAAMTSDILAQHADFFSIGTNDLIQYTIAVDRGNERVAYLHQPFHPAVLRLIQRTIDAAHAAGISVGLCGEMAADPYAAIVLLGLGLDEFSMSGVSIPETKRLFRGVLAADARVIAGKVMTMTSPAEIEGYLKTRIDAESGTLR